MSATTDSLVPAATVQLSATAKDKSGQILVRSFAWTSSDPAKATVSTSGMVAGAAPGTAIITAAVDGKSATTTITVLDGGVVSSAGSTLTVESGSVQIVVPADALAATTNVSVSPSTAFANDPRVVKGTPFDFGPSGTLFAKPVRIRIKYDPANLPQGTEEAALQLHLSTPTGWQVVDGSTADLSTKFVTGDVSHFSVYAILTPVPVAAITIRSPPDNPISVAALVVGGTDQLTATPTDSQGATLSNRAITWATTDPTVASVTPTGLVTAINPGSAKISASAGGVTSSISITVTPIPVATVAVTLSSQSIQVGQTSQATAATTDAGGHALTGRAIAWSSDNAGVATVSTSGVVTAVAPGTAQIVGTSESKSGGTTITVTAIPVATVTITPATATVVVGGTQQLSAATRDAGDALLTGRSVTWSSSNTAVATVSATGVVTAVSAGTATITAASDGKTGTSSITITPVPVATVTLSAVANAVVLGQAQQLTATPKDAGGTALAGRTVNWVSSNPAVLSVSAASSMSTASGATVTVTAVGLGTATVTATSESAPSIATPVITVTAIPVVTVTVSPTSASLVVGITPTQQLTAVTKDASNNVLTGRSVTWSSSNPAAATVDANGFVTAVGAGSTTITATSETKTGTSSITVTLAPVATVTVGLAATSITAVGTTQATATTLDANSVVLIGRVVTWSSSNIAVATVSPQGLVTAVAIGTASIIATSEGISGSSSVTVSLAPVATIVLTPPSISIVDGATQQLTATLADANHNALSGRTIDWSTGAPGVATVSSTGFVTAVSPGVAIIAAVSESKVATANVTVTPVPVASVNVSLGSASVVAGQTTQATATTLDATGNTLAGRVIGWTSDNLSVATVSSSGLVSSVAAGTAHIIATSETKTGQASLTVTPVSVATVSVSPTSASVILGATQQLTATTKDASGSTLAGRAVTWSSSDNAVATVDVNGLVTSHAIGSATINATSEGKIGSSSIIVIPVPVASVTVSLTPNSITAVGTAQAVAVTLDAGGAVLTGRAVSWSSSNTAVATVSAQGVVSAVAVGTANIVGTSEGKTGSAPLTVTPAPVATVSVNPPSAIVVQGQTEQLTATLKDAHNNVLAGRTVTWSSSNDLFATVSATGLVTAIVPGNTATITATSEGQVGTSAITVSMVPVASVTVALSAATINVGQTTQASATLRDAGGNVLTGRTVVWTSDNNSVATVSSSGLVTALSVGSALISAASGGQAGSAALTVTPIPVASVSVSLAASPIQIGQTTQATATTRDAANNVLAGRAIAWSSDNTSVATVSSTGLVTAIATGNANIAATSEGKIGTAPLTVIPVPVASLTLSASATPVILGQTQQLTAAPKDGSGSTLAGRTVSWVSSNPAVLALSAPSSVSTSSGATITVTAAGVGTAIITATSETAPSVSTPVITVNPIPVATVTVSPGSASLVLGITSTQQLTATLNDANNNVLTGRLVTWSTSNTSAASVDANGFVTAVGGGSTTITATSETQTGTASITVTVPVATVAVSPSAVTLPVNATHQLVATTNDASGNPLSGRTVTWSSSNPAVASVGPTGLVNAVTTGSATISATSEGKTGTSAITVTPIPVASVSASLASTTLQVGQTTQATATTFDAGNNVLTGRVVIWSTGNAGVATVSSSGVVSAVGAGSTTIIATSEGKPGSAPLTVIPVPVASVAVTPPTANVIAGATQQLSAETRDANNVVLTGRSVIWSSSNTAVATVSTAGLVSAVSVGGATITAASEGKSGTSSITVIPVPVNSVTVALSPNSITAVGTAQATATTLDANGGVLSGRTVTWGSSNTAVATVSSQGVITAIAVGSTSIIATSEGKTGSAPLTVTPAPVATVTVSPPSVIVVQATTEQLTVTLEDGHQNVLSRAVSWSSSNDVIASVSQTGLVTANSTGTATITATSESQSGTSSVTVSPVPVGSVSVTLTSGTITDAQSTQATAIVKDANGNVLTGRTINWSSDNTAVATVSPTGVVTAIAAGSAQIRASSGGQTGSALLTVIPRVAAVIVSPPSANVVIGANLQVSAQARDAGNNVLSGRTVTWSSDAPSIASVSTSGLVTAVALGSATITATSEGKTGTASITVVPVPVALVTVSLASTSIIVGQPTQATATTRDAAGNILTGRSITWSSGTTAIATVSSSGVVTAVSPGSVQIIAMSETKTGSATLTVNPAPVATVALSAPATPMVIGGTQVLTAQPKDAGGNTLSGRTVTWASSNTGVLTVSALSSVSTASGATVTIAAVGTGTATITATSESAPSATTPAIVVNPIPVVTVAVSLAPTSITAVGTSQASATTLDANGNPLAGRVVTWSSDNLVVATVSSTTGLVTAVSAGTANIIATSEGKTGSAPLTVTPAPVAAVTVSAPTTPMIVGGTQQLTATTKDAKGAALTGRPITWVSSNLAVLTVSASGSPATVTAVGVGTATITAASESVNSSPTPTITVNPVPVATVTLSAPTTPMVAGGSQVLTATPKDGSGNALSGRIVNWSSSNTAVLTVSASSSVSTSGGATVTITAAGAGTATITATSESASSVVTPTITVNPVPVATVTVNPPTASLILGITPTQQLTVVTKDANGIVLTGRTVTWASSNTAAASVGVNGLVTAVGAGSTTITATSETKTGTSSITVTLAPVTTVTVSAPATPVIVGGTQVLTAVARDVNGTVLTGRTVSWVSSNTAVLTVSPASGTSGSTTVTAVGVGTATITATSETVSSSPTPTITVNPVPVATVTVTPPSASLVLGITPTQQLTAVTKDANGTVLTGRLVTWSSSNIAAASVDANGMVTAVGAGVTTITATSETKAGTSSITVTLAPVATVTVSAPTTPMVVGGTQQLTAVTKDANGNVLTGRTITWSSSATAVVTVGASGSPATVTAVGVGTATITATSESISSSPTPIITVNPTPVASVTVGLAPTSITAVGTSQATATTLDANGTTLIGRVVTWSSGNIAVATVSATGLVTAVSAGTANIVATSEGKTGSAPLTVTSAPVASVTVSLSLTSITAVGTSQATAATLDANGAVLTGRSISWNSSNNSVATVSAQGLVTGIAAGTATITATSEGKSGGATMTVTLAPVATVTVSLASSSINAVQTTQASAALLDAQGRPLTGRILAWSSDNTAVATVSATTGLVTAVTAGTANIAATSEGKTGSAALTVTPAPVATLTISAPTTPMIVGGTQPLIATTKDAKGAVLTGRAITWVSSNPAVLTVSASGTPATVTAVGVGAATITATSESVNSSPTPTITVNPIPVATVAVSLAPTSITAVGTSQASATTLDPNGNTLLGRTVTWNSDNAAVATVSATTGLVTAVSAGTANITATSEGKSGSAPITVTQAPVATVTVALTTGSINAVQTTQATATLLDAQGRVLTGRTIDWTSDNPGVATVSAAGVVTAVSPGTANISATSETKSGSAALTVTSAPVNTVTVTPSSASLVLGVTPTQQLTAVTKDANGNVLTGRLVTWSSSNSAVATVDASTGLVTAVAAGGPVTITATSETKTGTSSITVSVAPVNTVTVSPTTASIFIAGMQQLTATLKDVNNTVLTGRVVTWSSNNAAVATVDVSTGLVTGVAAGGPVTITAMSETKTGTSSITVTPVPVATVTVTPLTASIIVGGTQQLLVVAKDAGGNTLTGRVVTWTSDNAAATVDANGLVTGVSVGGPVTITATSETKTGTSSITVTPVPVATVTVTPATASLVLGVTPTQQLSAVTKDANGVVLSGRSVTWTSSTPAVATVDVNGLVTAVAVGSTTITATSETKTGTSSITVSVAPVNTVTVSPTTASVFIAGTQQLTATLKDVNNTILTGRAVTWTSGTPGTATVDANGLVTAVAVGSTTITATSETKTGTSSITVTVAPVNTVTVTPPSASLVLGGTLTQQLTATLKDVNNNLLTGRAVTWTTSTPAAATVDANGLVTAVGPGSTVITATSETKTGTSSITVTLPTASLLHRSTANPRYFENAANQIVYLTGSHTWSNLQDNGTVDPPPAFNYPAYLDFLTAHNHNFFRLWAWEQSKWTAEIIADYWITPGPFARTDGTSGNALDGKPKYDLSQFNQAYFDRLRSRVQDAGARGIYVSVMLFDGWSVATKNGPTFNNPWKGHPFNAANNINSINGDTNGDGLGLETQTLVNTAVTAFQDAYVRKVIDAVGDLDNVLYEIDNEGDVTSKAWQYHMIQVIKDYEATKPKQHPIGMTAMFPGGSDSDLSTSAADWISTTGNPEAPITADGSKVLISDTDHLCGICGSTSWVWKTFAKGQNPILMDGYDGAAVGLGAADYTASNPVWEDIRKNMGYARSYAQRMDLKAAVPHGDLVLSETTGYSLAKPGSQYLVYLPTGGSVTLNLSAVVAGNTLSVEWFNPATGATIQAGTVSGGSSVTIPAAPFSGPSVLFLH